jgi:hypothetical protein
MVTTVPTGPEVGEMLLMVGVWAKAEGRKADTPCRDRQIQTRSLTIQLPLCAPFLISSPLLKML